MKVYLISTNNRGPIAVYGSAVRAVDKALHQDYGEHAEVFEWKSRVSSEDARRLVTTLRENGVVTLTWVDKETGYDIDALQINLFEVK